MTAEKFAQTVQKDLVVKIDSNEKWSSVEKGTARQNAEILVDGLKKVNFGGQIDESSFVWLKNGILKTFSDGSVIFDKSTTELNTKEVINKLAGVNDSDIKDWMFKSKKLVLSANIYRRKYIDYLVSKFATSNQIEIRMSSRTNGMQIGGELLEVVSNVLANKIPDDKSVYEAQGNVIDSKLLTLLTVKLFDDYSLYMETVDDIVNTSIASEVFGKKYPNLMEKQLDFEQSKPYIDKVIEPIIFRDNGTTIFYLNSFEWAMYPLRDVKLIDVGIPKINAETYAKVKPPAEYHFTIKFKNNQDIWELLSDVKE